MNCSICGFPLPFRTSKVGRPAEYHPVCKRIENMFSQQENLLSGLVCTSAKKKELRARLWTLANTLNGRVV